MKKKIVVLVSIVVCCHPVAYSQHDADFRKIFDAFKQETEGRFVNFRDSVNREYAGYLSQLWEEFDIQQPKPVPQQPLPGEDIRYKPSDKEEPVELRIEQVIPADSYIFEMTDNQIFGFTRNKLNRIPEDTIWGDISYMSDMTPAIADEFLADMAALGAETGTLAPGYYREFEIDKDGKAVQPEPDNPNHPRRSRYFPDDIAKVDQLIRQYLLESEKDNLYISVYTDKGEQFLSWMYDR